MKNFFFIAGLCIALPALAGDLDLPVTWNLLWAGSWEESRTLDTAWGVSHKFLNPPRKVIKA
ncbi:MAG: hypothetical protein FWB78_10050 [Treponema sp.]|nr:hypothetical protein [Treponema sp.]